MQNLSNNKGERQWDPFVTVLISRNIPQAIIDEIELLNPDIVVMGSHGLTGLKKILLGSVTTAVLRKSTVPILVVK